MLNTSHEVTQGTGYYHFPRMTHATHLLRCFQHLLETKHLGVTVELYLGRGEPEDSAGPEDGFGGSAGRGEERGGEEE